MIEDIRDTAVSGDSRRADEQPGGDDRVVGRAPDAVARSDAAIVLDARGRVANVTPSARCILGVRTADVMGTAIGQLAVPEDRLRLARWLTAHQGSADRQGRADLPPIAFRVARRHGRHADAVVGSLGLGTESESPRVLVELTVGPEPLPEDRRSQVVELQERVNQLERTNRQLEVSACTAAHDLQAPLASVAASIELLVRQAGAVLDETSQELVGDVLRSVGQMSRLVDGLLRSSQAGVRLQVELADGDALIGDVMRELQPDLDAAEGIVTVAPLGPMIRPRWWSARVLAALRASPRSTIVRSLGPAKLRLPRAGPHAALGDPHPGSHIRDRTVPTTLDEPSTAFNRQWYITVSFEGTAWLQMSCLVALIRRGGPALPTPSAEPGCHQRPTLPS